MPTLLWFRRDLRLTDLPPLVEAGSSGDPVLACFVLDPRLLKNAGPRRLQYLGDCLRELHSRLDGRLLITEGLPEQRIPEISRAIDATAVHVSADFSPFGVRRDEAVAGALAADGISIEATGSPYLVSPGRVAKSDGSPYRVFTPYFARWRDVGWRSPAESGPHTADWLDPRDVSATVPEIEPPDLGVALDIEPGETAALRQWAEFLDGSLNTYTEDRDRPDRAATSRMSAHLKFGSIHPRTIAADLSFRDPGPGAYLRELAFRDFYGAVLHSWPHSAWRNWNRNFDAIEVDTGDSAQRAFESWKEGRTGYPIVDAGMRQLLHTGFMHNRVRMIVASFLVKDLHLPWQWGAQWFLSQLVDGDIASNQHGWQWSAGSGTDAAPYFRVFNPTAQGEKFDPAGDYVRRWVPELADVDDVHRLKTGRPAQYPQPIVDHSTERREALRRYGQIT